METLREERLSGARREHFNNYRLHSGLVLAG